MTGLFRRAPLISPAASHAPSCPVFSLFQAVRFTEPNSRPWASDALLVDYRCRVQPSSPSSEWATVRSE